MVWALLLVPATLMGVADPLSREVLSWRPTQAWSEPWRWWSAAWVHLSAMHWLANLLGALLLALFGWLLNPPRVAAWAWAMAWPLTHLSLLLQPQLQRYGGLSGVLHAGVAVCATGLCLGGRSVGERWLGAAVMAGLLLKVMLEQPWAGPLIEVVGWDIAIAPLAHASGVFWGTLLGTVVFRFAAAGPLASDLDLRP
jgi:rhomboid family GlyGly-CTERM serine protease